MKFIINSFSDLGLFVASPPDPMRLVQPRGNIPNKLSQIRRIHEDYRPFSTTGLFTVSPDYIRAECTQ